MEDNGSLTRVAAFPIGIDPERFQRALERVDVRSHIAELLNRYAGRKVRMLSEPIITTIINGDNDDHNSINTTNVNNKCSHNK